MRNGYAAQPSRPGRDLASLDRAGGAPTTSCTVRRACRLPAIYPGPARLGGSKRTCGTLPRCAALVGFELCQLPGGAERAIHLPRAKSRAARLLAAALRRRSCGRSPHEAPPESQPSARVSALPPQTRSLILVHDVRWTPRVVPGSSLVDPSNRMRSTDITPRALPPGHSEPRERTTRTLAPSGQRSAVRNRLWRVYLGIDTSVLGGGVTVTRQTLDLFIGVRIPASQPTLPSQGHTVPPRRVRREHREASAWLGDGQYRVNLGFF